MSDIRISGTKRSASEMRGERGGGGPTEAGAPVRKSPRLAGVRIDNATHQQNVALGDRQAQGDQGGGVGIPGPRTLDKVREFLPMVWGPEMPAQLAGILRGSEVARGRDLGGKQEVAQANNRQVVFQEGQTGFFSLHVANDIAGVWNSPTKGSKVYDYPTLTSKLEQRFQPQGEKYFTGDKTVEQRRAHVAEGMQHIIAGDIESANTAFRNAGATSRGQKWINKFSTLMLSERAREVHAGIGDPKRGLTHAALEEIRAGGSSFSAKFMPGVATVARFVGQGGAEAHRKHADSLRRLRE